MASQTFGISVDLASFEREMDGIVVECHEAARPAAQAMAQVLYEAVKVNVARIRPKTGKLAGSIYQAYSKRESTPGHAVYHVSWNARKAPHGHLVEFGHLQRYEISFDKATGRFITHKDKPLPTPKLVAARPFVRPAMAHFDRAAAAGRARYLQELAERGVLR